MSWAIAGLLLGLVISTKPKPAEVDASLYAGFEVIPSGYNDVLNEITKCPTEADPNALSNKSNGCLKYIPISAAFLSKSTAATLRFVCDTGRLPFSTWVDKASVVASGDRVVWTLCILETDKDGTPKFADTPDVDYETGLKLVYKSARGRDYLRTNVNGAGAMNFCNDFNQIYTLDKDQHYRVYIRLAIFTDAKNISIEWPMGAVVQYNLPFGSDAPIPGALLKYKDTLPLWETQVFPEIGSKA